MQIQIGDIVKSRTCFRDAREGCIGYFPLFVTETDTVDLEHKGSVETFGIVKARDTEGKEYEMFAQSIFYKERS